MVDYVQTFTATDLDSNGNQVVGSDHVIDVFYYDSSDESWRRDFSAITNPFSNPEFTETTVTGTGPGNITPGWYESGVDISSTPAQRFFKVGKIPFDYADEVLAAHATVLSSTPTSRGNVNKVTGDYFIDADSATTPKNLFPDNYTINTFDTSNNWASTSGITNHARVTWSLDETVEVAGFFVDSHDGGGITDADTNNCLIGFYNIQVATTGTGTNDNDFTTVASGTNKPGWNHPLWIEITPTPAKFIRILFKNNGGTRANLTKFFAYTKETIDRGMSLSVTRVADSNTVVSATRTFEINQIVNLTGLDHIYFDLKDYFATAIPTVSLNGTTKSSFRLANVQDTSDMFSYRRGYAISTAGFGQNTTFRISKPMSSSPSTLNQSGFMAITNFSAAPTWYSEDPSAKRGTTRKFPTHAAIVSDDLGLSIVDLDDATLWMRFDIGHRKMLQEKAQKIWAREGKIYMATSRGLFILNFPANRCDRIDERGSWSRHGIDFRNENSFDLEEWSTSTAPQRMLHEYMYENTAPVFSERLYFDIVAGNDGTFGNYVLLGTSNGLMLYNDTLGAGGLTYSSLDTAPVYKIFVVNGSIWYLQGEGRDQSLRYISSISAAATANFTYSRIFHKELSFHDGLSGPIDPNQWEILNQDEDMEMFEGEFLTISGTHNRGGATGILLKGNMPDRSFTAKVKVRIKEFPPDARGAVRFGLVRDYHPASVLSLMSDKGDSTRAGFFMSAFNRNSFGWPLIESAPLDNRVFGVDRGYVLASESPGGSGTGKSIKLAFPTTSGVRFRNYAGDSTGVNHVNAETINRVSTFPMLARDFTIRATVSLPQGFTNSVNATLESNPAAFLGITRNGIFIPGQSQTGNFIDTAMMATGRTTFSGSLVYTVGKYETDAEPGTVTLTQPLPAVSSPATPREWRIDYDNGSHTLRAFIDGVSAGSLATSDFTNPHKIGLIFGIGSHAQSATASGVARQALFGNIRAEYPALISGSRYQYGLESTDSDGYVHQTVSFYTAASGIAMSGDTVPASGTLPKINGLSDGNITTGVFSPSLNASIGVALSGIDTVEAMYLYDSSTGTSGWNNTSAKNVNVWYSNNNLSWTFYKTFDLNTQERVSGLTKLRFSPAINAKFIKANAVSSTYAVPGGGSWAITEVRAATTSGIGFFTSDNTPDAEFHEWKLEYTKSTGELKGYIDDVLIAKGNFSGTITDARLLLAHDLSVVSSGTHSDFHGDFKDLEIVYTDTPYLVAGELTGLAVNHATLSGGNPNYTIFSASTSGIVISDIDFGSSPIASTIRSFNHTTDIFGDSTVTPAVAPDSEAHRDTGLVFIGTNTGTPAYYRKKVKLPYWFGVSDFSTFYEYGNAFAWCPLSTTGEVFVLHDRNALVYVIANLETGLCKQLTRGHYKDALGLMDQGTGFLDLDAPKFVHSPYDGKIWSLVPPQRIATIDTTSGEAVQATYGGVSFATATGDTVSNSGGRYYIAYSLHNHKIICGQNYIQVFDATTATGLFSPQNRSTFSGRWGRSGELVPWSPGGADTGDDTGSASAIYSDYDRCVYIIGSPTTGYGNTIYFVRYHVDKNYLETISTGSDSAPWPITDEELYVDGVPVSMPAEKVTNITYDPRRARIYVLSRRSVKGVLMYYDIVNERWVDTGEDPPFTSMKEWPAAATDLPDSNHIAYDLKNDRLLCATGRGGTENSYIYELHKERDTFKINFDYLPERDGLPTASGVAKHFTTASGLLSWPYSNSTTWDKDFYFTSSNNSNQYFQYTFDPQMITISGANPSAVTTNDVFELYVSSDTIDSNRNFEVSAKVALPKFTRNIFVSSGSARRAQAYFIFGLSDGLNRPWAATTTYGQEDPALYQSVEFRAGVSGTINDSVTQFPLVGHLHYIDGFNTANEPGGSVFDTRPQVAYDSYLVGGVDLGSAFSTFKEFKLRYDYESDTATAFVDGVNAGTTVLRRKFGSNGVRFHIGFVSRSNNDISNNHQWVVQVKDLKVATGGTDKIRNKRLITTVSGIIGTYRHEKWDATLVSGVSWIYNTNVFFPSSRKSNGYDYIATIGGIGDGNKLVELVSYIGAGSTKRIGLIGDLDSRHSSATYLATTDFLWDDLESAEYIITRDIRDDIIRVYLENDPSPIFEVPYESFPAYKYQHVYYGKVNYGNFERVYESPTLSGTWTASADYTGTSDPVLGKLAFNSNARFATVAQGLNAKAIFELDPNLGSVSVYAFYHATGFDAPRDAPYTIYADGILDVPTNTGEGQTIFSVDLDVDEFGNSNPGKHTIRVDQRRVRSGEPMQTNKDTSQASGWIYLGRYINPYRIVQTAQAHMGTTSTQGFVCADAIGIDIGRYGKSTFEMSVGKVRYRTDALDFPVTTAESAGLSVIDLSTNQRIDEYGKFTGPGLLDGNITSGRSIE